MALPHFTVQPPHTHSYLMPSVFRMLEKSSARRVFDLGCGNGSCAKELESHGYEVVGVDPSESGIKLAGAPNLHVGSTDDDLAARFGTFPIVLSLEVVEHVYSPQQYVQRVRDLLEPGGLAVISTPYHSYFKNLVLAVSGKMDNHFDVAQEGGHIKFWSRKTIGKLFATQGMRELAFERVGRLPPLAKSMVLAFQG